MKQNSLSFSSLIFCFAIMFLAGMLFQTDAYGKQPSGVPSYFVMPVKGTMTVVKASEHPIKGNITMDLEVLLEIDADKASPDTPIFFHNVAKMKDGRFLFSDFSLYKIHIISPEGKLMGSFFSKGEGPGELPYGIFTVQPQENVIFVCGKRKFIRFDNNGHLLDDKTLKREYRNVFMLDNGQYIANYFVIPNENETRKTGAGNVVQHYMCSLFDKEEQIIETYIDAPGAGVTQINEKVGEQTIRMNFFSVLISPEIIHISDPAQKRAFFCLTNHYQIVSMDTSNHRGFIIEKANAAQKLSTKDREELISMSFEKEPPHIKKIIQQKLPSHFCSIANIQNLPGGHLAVMTITGIHSLPEIDIYDSQGRYLYHLRFPDTNKQAHIKFSGSNLAALEKNEEGDIIYRKYRIKNLKNIF